MSTRVAFAALALLGAADDPLAGRVPGKIATCIDPGFVQEVQVVDEHTILYKETGRRLWRTGPDAGCHNLEPRATLIVESRGGLLCRGDYFRVRRASEAIATTEVCRFTSFTPYDKR